MNLKIKMEGKNRRIQLSVAEKLKVLTVAKEIGNRAASRQFDMSEGCIRQWRKKEDRLRHLKQKCSGSRIRLDGAGRCLKDPGFDKDLLEWFLDQRQNGIAITSQLLRLQAQRMNKNPSFKASTGWYRQWKKRHGVSTRYKTSLAQRLPKNAEINVTNFHHFVIQQRQKHSYSLHNIINMDETLVRFDMPGKKTLTLQGSRTVPVATTGADKECFTVALAVRGDGEKMDSVVILKGVQMPKDLRVPKGIVV